ncbi:MAG TPA: hypothetical protein VLA92_01805 [Candidatus Saccharimonadales bacterium]|nr:hypothetical protein [Candidatus Saccharimonadales bacterium]
MIFIASSSLDRLTVEPVASALKRKGADVLIYNGDDVIHGKQTMGYQLLPSGEQYIAYGKHRFSPGEIRAAWFRRPTQYRFDEPTKLQTVFLDGQRKTTQVALWRAIPNERWLNAPGPMVQAKDKALQLRLAHEVGLTIPKTVITNDWNTIWDTLPGDEVILKMPYGVLYSEHKSRFLPSTIVKRSDRKRLAKTNPFPGIWQEYVPKKCEWRITVVRDQVFAVAIYVDNKARGDWRVHQFDKSLVSFKKEQLPAHIGKASVSMLRQLNMGFGAFDIIQTPNDEFVFLEVNLDGQYQWLVDELGLPIPEAIADALLAIST